jgi:hypothetical protein
MATHDPTDYDSSIYAGHHSLGPRANQAAAGNHKHKQKDTTDTVIAIFQRAATQSIPNNTVTAVQFTLEVIDSDNIGDLAVSNTTFTIKTPGVYLAHVKGAYANNVTGIRQFWIVVNGANTSDFQLNANTTGTFFVYVSNFLVLAAGDTVQFQTLQNSGAALNFSAVQLSLLKVHD